MQTILRQGAIGLSMFALVALLALTTQVQDTQAGLASYASNDTVPFSWMDISGTGTPLATLNDCDDCAQANVPIGFTFNFAGTDYTQLEPTTNGVVSLDQEDSTEYDNNDYGPLPTSEWTGAALFPFWDDLYPEEAGTIYAQTLGSAPNRIFVLQYDGITSYDEESLSYLATFQMALCEGSNNVVFQYLDTVFAKPGYPEHDNGGDATVGIQESDTSALQYSHMSPVIMDDMAIAFYPTSGSANNCLAGPAPTATPTATPIAPTDTPVPGVPTAAPMAPTATPEANATVFTGDIEVVDDGCGDGTIALTVNPDSTGITTVVVADFMVSGSPNNLTLDFDPAIAINADGSFSNSGPLPPPLEVINATIEGTFDFSADPATASGTITIGLVADPSTVLCEADFTAEALAAGVVPPTATPVVVELPETGTAASADAGSSWLVAVLASLALVVGLGFFGLRLRARNA